jgi:hypothetical protein
MLRPAAVIAIFLLATTCKPDLEYGPPPGFALAATLAAPAGAACMTLYTREGVNPEEFVERLESWTNSSTFDFADCLQRPTLMHYACIVPESTATHVRLLIMIADRDFSMAAGL